MTILEYLEEVDDTLSNWEDYFHGQEGADVTEARSNLAKVVDLLTIDMATPKSLELSLPDVNDDPRYVIIEGSESNHCCFEYTIVDTKGGKLGSTDIWSRVMCEAFEKQEAVEICTALNSIKSLDTERFSIGQMVQWGGLRYWVMEDGGGDRVLIANSERADHPEYNDWWVPRGGLIVL